MVVVLRHLGQKRMLDNFHNERPVVWVLLETFGNEIVILLRPVRLPIKRWRRIAHDLEHGTGGVHVRERWLTIAQLNRRNAQSPHVRPIIVDIFVCGDGRCLSIGFVSYIQSYLGEFLPLLELVTTSGAIQQGDPMQVPRFPSVDFVSRASP